MRKYCNVYMIVMLPIVFSVVGCYDDKSTYPISPINGIIIDAVGIPEELYVGYMEELILAPDISRGDNDNDSGLQYEWAITETTSLSSDFEVVSREKELHFIVNRPVSFAHYTVKLTVTDNENGDLQYLRTWKMYVRSTFVDGLLVSDTYDSQTSDFTYIKNSTLTVNHTDAEKIYRNIITEANGAPYKGLLSSLTYEVRGYTTGTLDHTNQVWALTPEGYCIRFDCKDFSINGNSDSESLLIYKPEGFKFHKLFKACQMFFAVTSHGIYSYIITNNIFSWYDPLIREALISGNIVAANSSTYVYYNHTVFLDERDGKFRSYTAEGSLAECNTYQANSIFDPNAMQDKTAVAAGINEDADIATFLLRDDNTGEYGIYTLNGYREIFPDIPASAGNMYIIPPAGKALLDKAVSVFFAQKELVMYVAVEEGIYAITYGIGNMAVVDETSRFSPAGEKITNAKLYQQGHYVNDMATIIRGYITELSWNNRAVIVSTQAGEYEGKVYVIPITQPGIGAMDPSRALVYDGFGKVLDVITIGY